MNRTLPILFLLAGLAGATAFWMYLREAMHVEDFYYGEADG